MPSCTKLPTDQNMYDKWWFKNYDKDLTIYMISIALESAKYGIGVTELITKSESTISCR